MKDILFLFTEKAKPEGSDMKIGNVIKKTLVSDHDLGNYAIEFQMEILMEIDRQFRLSDGGIHTLFN